MRFRPRAAAAAMTVLAVACATQPSAEELAQKETAAAAAMADSARAMIDAANARAAAAINANDVAAWAEAYADDAIVMQPDEPAWRGKADLVARATAMLQAVSLSNVKFTTQDVMASGDLAVETGAFSWTLTPKGGKPMDQAGKYVAVWKKQADGSWKIVRDINNSDAPAPK